MFRLSTLLSVLLVLAACGGPAPPQDYALRRPRTASIEWLGHHSFLITSSLGVRLLTDPYAPGSVPHRFPAGLRPDVLLISREDRKSNYDAAVENIPRTFRSRVALGSHSAFGIPLRGEPAGDSVVYWWTMDGMRFCFPGAAAALPEASAPADVLFLPVGGRMSSAAQERLLASTRPRLIIPMGPSGEAAAWAARFGPVHRVPGTRLLINRETLPHTPTAIVLPAP